MSAFDKAERTQEERWDMVMSIYNDIDRWAKRMARRNQWMEYEDVRQDMLLQAYTAAGSWHEERGKPWKSWAKLYCSKVWYIHQTRQDIKIPHRALKRLWPIYFAEIEEHHIKECKLEEWIRELDEHYNG